MTTSDTFEEFLAAVDDLHDGGAVRLTAHTASVSADAWSEPAESAQAAPAASTD